MRLISTSPRWSPNVTGEAVRAAATALFRRPSEAEHVWHAWVRTAALNRCRRQRTHSSRKSRHKTDAPGVRPHRTNGEQRAARRRRAQAGRGLEAADGLRGPLSLPGPQGPSHEASSARGVSPTAHAHNGSGGRGSTPLYARPRPARDSRPLDWSPGACAEQPLTWRGGPAFLTWSWRHGNQTKHLVRTPLGGRGEPRDRCQHPFGGARVETYDVASSPRHVSRKTEPSAVAPARGALHRSPGSKRLGLREEGLPATQDAALPTQSLRLGSRCTPSLGPDLTEAPHRSPSRDPHRRTLIQPKQPWSSRLSVSAGKPFAEAPGTSSHVIGQRGTTCAFLS